MTKKNMTHDSKLPSSLALSRRLLMTAFLCLSGLWPQWALADIYVYRNFYGRMTFSDRPLEQPGYELSKRIRTKATNPLSNPTAEIFDSAPSRNRYGSPKRHRNVATYESQIQKAARSYDVDPSLIKAVIHVESNFNPRAVSRVGAQGLMQLMPNTADQYAVQNPFDPIENIHAGARHLGYLLKKYNHNIDLTLAAYNAGEGRVSQYGGIPPYQETRNYVRQVKKARAVYNLAASGVTLR